MRVDGRRRERDTAGTPAVPHEAGHRWRARATGYSTASVGTGRRFCSSCHICARLPRPQGFALVPGQALPNGALVAIGESSWQHGNAAAEIEIATAVPLAYDASCAAGAPTPFRAGEVHARAANADGQAVVRIVFANCQAPAITLVAHN
jgi:hypothetical protein